MKNKGLKTKLRFTFNIEDEVPVVDFKPSEKKEEKKKESITINFRKNGRDSSTNSPGLF